MKAQELEDFLEQKGPETVLMAMSGGVDSSAAAIVLGREGYEVVGATMGLLGSAGGSCSTSADIEDAKECARRLGIAHHVLDMREAFNEEVIDRFCNGYFAGETPNPCIDCNRFIKFGLLEAKRDEMGFEYLATGHYARREFDPSLGRYVLRKGADAGKDQSYVLAFLSQAQLARTLFPLGALTKSEVREMAAEAGFSNADKGESQDICFVQDGKYAEFIEDHTGCVSEAGPILDEEGNVLGRHDGLLRYTIGQRKGFGIAAPHPLYVVAKDAKSNALVVGPKESLMVSEVSAHKANLVTYEIGDVAGKPISGSAKTHYRHRGEACEAVFGRDGSLNVAFDSPVTKPASGQTLVVYKGDTVVGAGIID